MIKEIPVTPLSVESVIEDESTISGLKNIKHKVYWGEKEAPNLIVENNAAKKLSSLYGIRVDLECCSSWLRQVTNNKLDAELSRAYMTSFGVTYSRCFNSGSRTKLSKNKIFKTEPDLLKIHDQIIKLRNEYLAHSGTNYLERYVVVAVFEPGVHTIDNMNLLVVGRHKACLGEKECEEYNRVVDFVKEVVQKEIENLQKYIIRRIKEFGKSQVVELISVCK